MWQKNISIFVYNHVVLLCRTAGKQQRNREGGVQVPPIHVHSLTTVTQT